MIRLLTIGAACLITACASKPVAEISPPAPTGIVVVRDYVDSIKTSSGDVYRKVQYAWDYTRNVAIIRQYQLDGTLISIDDEPALTLETTDAELAYAFSLVRNDPQLGSIARQKGTRLYGGFSLRVASLAPSSDRAADNHCRAKTRCIHVMMSGGKDGELALGHAIVDLSVHKIVDHQYSNPAPQGASSASAKSNY
jgi:hypothetical protein